VLHNDKKAPSIVLDDGRVITHCDECRTHLSERTPPQIPNCEDCPDKQISLLPENVEVGRLFNLVRWQTIVTELKDDKRVVDLNLIAVNTLMDIFQVKNKRKCFLRIINLFHKVAEMTK